VLPPSLWRLHGVRPINHPQRRLALAAAWVADASGEAGLEDWFRNHASQPGPETEAALLDAFKVEPDAFWRRHYTLTSRRLPDVLPMLGSGRLNDLVVNVVLPWFWARSQAGGDAATRHRVESLYLDWSPGEDNATLKLARARLFGTDSLPIRKTAAVQQGLLQVVRDFCSQSNALCDGCRFPGLVAAWNSTGV
jgi:hypothetical protein